MVFAWKCSQKGGKILTTLAENYSVIRIFNISALAIIYAYWWWMHVRGWYISVNAMDTRGRGGMRIILNVMDAQHKAQSLKS